MAEALPLYLEGAPVKLFRGSIRLPLIVSTLRVRHNWVSEHIFGNPMDWTQKLWTGGEVTMTGLVLATSNFNLLQGLTWESMTIGATLLSTPVCTIYGLHREQSIIRMDRVGDLGYIGNGLTFRFDGYTS